MTNIFDLFKTKYDCPVCYESFVIRDNSNHDYVERIINHGEENQGSTSAPMCLSCSEQKRRLMKD